MADAHQNGLDALEVVEEVRHAHKLDGVVAPPLFVVAVGRTFARLCVVRIHDGDLAFGEFRSLRAHVGQLFVHVEQSRPD